MYKSLICGILSLCLTSLWAQTIVGSVDNLKQQLESAYLQNTQEDNLIFLKINDDYFLKGKILSKTIDGFSTIYNGTIKDKQGGFTFTLKNGEIEGELIVISERQAFRYRTDKTSGDLIITEESIHKHICIDEGLHRKDHQKRIQETTPNIPIGVNVNKLESYPNAPAVVYLDFDGHNVTDSWWTRIYNNSQTYYCTPANLIDEQMYEIWEVVSEDFRPFNINITTDSTVFNAVEPTMRQRVVITRTSNWQSLSTTGIARIGAFRQSDSPVFSFPSGLSRNQDRAEVTSHEIGHALGLTHDGATGTNSTNYYRGHGEWCTIMGAGYSDDITQWSKGEYPNANNTQDDIAIISGTSNKFGFRKDDHGNTSLTGTAITQSPDNKTIKSKSNSGVISERTDVDVWLFGTSGGKIDLKISAFHVKPNLDIEAKLYDSNDKLIATSDVQALFHAEFKQTLASGTYYIVVDGVGYADLVTGYSDYGSLGHYDISGTIENFYSTLTDPPSVNITTPTDKDIIEVNSFNPITLKAEASDSDGSIKTVYFEIDGVQINATLKGNEYTAQWTPKKFGEYKIEAYAVDDLNATAYDEIGITITEKLVNHNINLLSIKDENVANCSTSINLQINVENRGNNLITSYDIETYLNNQLIHTSTQFTNLSSRQTEVVSLEPIQISNSGDQKVKVKLVMVLDEVLQNNEIEKTYNISFGETYQFYISERSRNPEMIWNVKNEGNTIFDQNISAVETGDLTVQNFCLAPSTCFDITIDNPFKDGNCKADEWVKGKEYCIGAQITRNGILYEAQWCNRNEPGVTQWSGWTELGPCQQTYDHDVLGIKNLQNQNKEFEVKVKDWNGTVTEKICTKIITNTISQTSSNIIVFPNPFENSLSIQGITEGTVSIVNQLGTIVLTQDNVNTICTENLPKGLYILNIQYQETTTHFKIMKE